MPRILASPTPGGNLVVYRAERDRLGMAHVRFQQNLGGVQVMGGDLVVHLDASDRVRSAGGRFLPPTGLNTVPALTAEQASTAATAFWYQGHSNSPPTKVSKVQLRVYSPSWLQNEADSESYLVWEVWLGGYCGAGCSRVLEAYYVDARSAELRGNLDLAQRLPRIYDCSAKLDNTCYSEYYDAAFNYTFGRREGAPQRGPNPRLLPRISTDVDDAYDLVGVVHQYLWSTFGRDGANGLGGTGNGTAHPYARTPVTTYLDFFAYSGGCPYDGAFFPDTCNIQLCMDIIVPDILSHEYFHALWYHLHNFVYSGETGALIEANSYILDEAFEAAVSGRSDWQSGTATPLDNYKRANLADPPGTLMSGKLLADRFYSPLVYCSSDTFQNYNKATIGGKAVYLASEGGYFNGCTIRTIGIERLEQIWYRAVGNYFVQAETFNGAFQKLLQATQDLYPGDQETLLQVRRAFQSVEMDQAGRCSGQPARVPQAIDVQGW